MAASWRFPHQNLNRSRTALAIPPNPHCTHATPHPPAQNDIPPTPPPPPPPCYYTVPRRMSQKLMASKRYLIPNLHHHETNNINLRHHRENDTHTYTYTHQFSETLEVHDDAKLKLRKEKKTVRVYNTQHSSRGKEGVYTSTRFLLRLCCLSITPSFFLLFT